MTAPVTVTMTFPTAEAAAIFLAGHRSPVEVSLPKIDTSALPPAAQAPGKSMTAATAAAAAGSTQTTSPAPASAPQAAASASEPTPGKSESAAPAAAPASAQSKADAPALGYDSHVKPAILAAAKVKREAVPSVLAEFGVDHGTKLKPEQYAAFMARLKEATEGVAA